MARAATLNEHAVDGRLLRLVANLVIAASLLALAGAGLFALARLPAFSLHGIGLEGDLTHNTEVTVRAHAAPKLEGGFFTMDLERARAAFESVPWVRRATVRRIWPDRLVVRLEEHRPAALWISEDGVSRLVNTFGDVFEPLRGDFDEEALPRFSGPPGSSTAVLAMYAALQSALLPMDSPIEALTLSGRGSWQVEMAGGVAIELGRGEHAELVARAARFARTLPQVMATYQRALLHADLRHTDGYAVRLKGITTFASPLKN